MVLDSEDLIYLLPSEAVLLSTLNGEVFDFINSCEATLLMYYCLCAVVAYISSKPIDYLGSFLTFVDSAMDCGVGLSFTGFCYVGVLLLSVLEYLPSDGGLLDFY